VRLNVDVWPAQRSQLAPAQTAENGEQHQGAVPATDSIGQGEHLGNCQDRPLRRPFLTSSLDPARVTADQPVSTAVLKTALSSRYALATVTALAPASRAAPLARPPPGSALGAPARHGRGAR
jgi:hypothetical protein